MVWKFYRSAYMMCVIMHSICAFNLYMMCVCNYALFVSLLCAKWKFYRFAFNLYIHDVLVEFSAEECVR